MAESVHDDVVEEIMLGLDANDLVSCRSVCKSWHSLISTSRFINRHLSYSYNKDRCSNELSHRRIFLEHNDGGFRLVGSCNGLVCISTFSSKVILGKYKLLVGNPLTREEKQLKLPAWIGLVLCWGFGYDSSRDDYKVIIGCQKGRNQTCVQVLSLKSNVWRVIGYVNYKFISKVGILCNGALHWIVKDQKKKKLIISYDLCEDEFKEIPQPDNAGYDSTYTSHVGVMNECLCICISIYSFAGGVWLMKNYNVKQSWEHLVYWKNYDIVHLLRSPKDESFFNDDASWFLNTSDRHLFWLRHYIDAPIFVQSLVSPHVNGRPKRDKRSAKWVLLFSFLL
ncbi:hypothetical protein L1987_67373 [Smallanthus sonchifolius]|uniref:Uncharacterized protein n=2 Tax=Smallanthus sonchifolius TaxID=185202 RepID=A0ACB9B311_9ASTR|nr:hypothetical protein L1987_67368 [Smallanthus sonchifolius]KAI3716472.1 hypothetical protein L1987_67373 [Smallanthus sonchifolius]